MILTRILSSLRRSEGLVLFPYDDATGKVLKAGDTIKGKITIGYGHNLSDNGISHDGAESMLIDDLLDAAEGLFNALPWTKLMGEVRQEVLIEMAFNLGVPKLLRFKHTLAAVRRGDYAAAARGMRASLWARQVKGRAVRLARAMETGAFDDA